MTLRSWIEETLEREFGPTRLSVVDESHLHEGHGGHRPGGETHFRVEIVSARFAGASRVQQHRLVNEALAPAFARGLHALALRSSAPPA